MKKKISLILAGIALLLLTGLLLEQGFFGRKPFKTLDASELVSAVVHLSPPDETIPITEIDVLVDCLNEVVIYREDNSYTDYSGQGVTFTLVKTDGTQIEVMAFNPFIIIDGVGYQCKYKPCEVLSRFANELLNERAYT